MAFTIERIKTYRRWFGWGFVGSFLVFVILLLNVATVFDAGSAPPLNRLDPAWLNPDRVLELGSLLTSFTTLIGFVVTTVIARRKERRESYHASLELEKNKLELEKLRREISDKNAAAQEKKKKMGKRRRVV